MQHGGRPNRVWTGSDLVLALTAADPVQWLRLRDKALGDGWRSVCRQHPAVFVYCGEERGEAHLCHSLWCCGRHVVPNWCCAWRWPCCVAPPAGLCRRYWGYDDIAGEVCTGDLFLFSGNRMLRVAGSTHWSHVGVVLCDTDGEHGPPGRKYIFEANHDKAGWDHCDLRLLREKVVTYKGGATD
eukprot:gene53298-38920_t